MAGTSSSVEARTTISPALARAVSSIASEFNASIPIGSGVSGAIVDRPRLHNSFMSERASCAFRKSQRALIEFAPPQSGRFSNCADGVFERCPAQRLPQQAIDILSVRNCRIRRRWRNDNDELAARLRSVCIGGGEREEIAAADFLVQLRQLATDRSGAITEARDEIGEGGRNPRSGLEQHERGLHVREFADARAARRLFCRQEAFEKKSIGR